MRIFIEGRSVGRTHCSNGEKTMRWKKWFGGLALMLTTASGCKQQVFLTKADLEESNQIAVTALENRPNATDKPITDIWAPPVTVNFPERKERFISLAEAISIALEQGTTGTQGLPESLLLAQGGAGNPGGLQQVVQDSLGAIGSPQSTLSSLPGCHPRSASRPSHRRRRHRVVAVQIRRRLVEQRDVDHHGSAIGTSVQTLEAAARPVWSRCRSATVSTGIIKPLSTGGVTSITLTRCIPKRTCRQSSIRRTSRLAVRLRATAVARLRHRNQRATPQYPRQPAPPRHIQYTADSGRHPRERGCATTRSASALS